MQMEQQFVNSLALIVSHVLKQFERKTKLSKIDSSAPEIKLQISDETFVLELVDFLNLNLFQQELDVGEF